MIEWLAKYMLNTINNPYMNRKNSIALFDEAMNKFNKR